MRSYAIFMVPAISSGQPNVVCCNSNPASNGVAAEARLRGTFVTPDAAARSSGGTTDITNACRAGTSIWANSARINSSVMAIQAWGANAARISNAFAGRWVNTIVRISPIRAARRLASSCELAPSSPAAKNTPPVTAADRSNRRCNQRISNDWTTKPLPAESTLNSAANCNTTRRDEPRARRAPGGEASEPPTSSTCRPRYTVRITTPVTT